MNWPPSQYMTIQNWNEPPDSPQPTYTQNCPPKKSVHQIGGQVNLVANFPGSIFVLW